MPTLPLLPCDLGPPIPAAEALAKIEREKAELQARIEADRKKVLFLDDDPMRHRVIEEDCDRHAFTHVHTVEQAIQALAQKHFDIVCLDHDLDGMTYVQSGKGTGFEVAEYMATGRMASKPQLVIVHSFNQVGAQLMLTVLKGSGYNAFCVPFSLLTLRNI